MRRLNTRILGTASLAVIAIAGFSGPAYGQVTESEAQACADLPTQPERDACIQAQAEDEEGAAESGDIATIPADEQAERQAEGQTVVVTGSRLRRSPFNTPDPVTIIDPELSLQEGDIETAEILQTTPIAAGSTQITSFLSTNFVTNGGPGAQTISLRGLGAERTLVLLNGRRAGPAGTRGAIASFDLNVLPSSIVQSVEILKTGASSIYGSDAVAGVVNVLTRRSTNGIELRAFGSMPEESGGETYDLAATYGREFSRGHFLVSASYFRRNELERRDRDYLGCTEDYAFNQQGERVDLIDPRTGLPACTGDTFGPVIALADFQAVVAGAFGIPNFQSNLRAFPGAPFAIGAIQYEDPNNPFGQFVQPLRDCTNFIEFCAPSNVFPINYDAVSTAVTNFDSGLGDSVIPETERYTLYANGAFEVTPDIELFGEFLYNKRKTRSDGSRQIFPQQFTGSSVLPFLFGFSDELFDGDPTNEEFSGEVILIPVAVTDHFGQRQEVDYYRGVLGAQGGFGDSGFLSTWNWNLWGQYSRSDGDYETDIVFQDAFDTFNLRTESCVGTTTAIRGVPCIDMDFTDPRVLRGDFTEEERAFLLGVDKGNTIYTQWTGEASVNGDVFQMPAGPVQAAVGVQWRRDEIDDQPGPATQAGNSWGLTAAGRTAGFQRTQEAFAEVEVPLIHNAPIVESLNLSAAGRFTNVYAERIDGLSDEDNWNFTYKLGLNWQVNEWVRLRGTYGTSFRAPALFEQFLNDQTSFAGQIAIDPCINWGQRLAQGTINQRIANNCAADGVPSNYTGGGTSSALILTGGGIGVLEPEESTAMTASVIFTPPGWLWEGGRFSLAVDYFDIRVEGEIATLGSANILAGCYNSEFFPDDPLCDLFVREMDPNDPRVNQILQVRNAFVNINSQNNRGIDVTARFTQDMGNLGRLSLLAQMTWQLEDEFALFAGTLTDDNGEMGDPIWVGDFNLTWDRDPITVVYGLDVIGGTSDRADVLRVRGAECFNNVFRGTICPDFRGEPTFYHSLSASVEVMDRIDLTLGVSNLLDEKPPRVSLSGSETGGVFGRVPILGSQYDYIGRRFFASITGRF